jgi:clorobiocin/coumermycin A biosynthesis protein CloN6/CouN6
MMELDLLLVHAPSVYDFRDRDDILFAYLSNSDSVHVSPIFEMPPVGILAIDQHVRRQGFQSAFINVASSMLKRPDLDVAELFRNVKTKYVGFDLHWLVHSQGGLALSKLFKEINPETKVLFGGIASTYHNEELLQYPWVDYVIRGYDTLYPVELLMKSKDRPEALAEIPNLTWRHGEDVVSNGLTYLPRVFSAAVNWSQVFNPDRTNITPYNLVIPQAGCEYNCKWCGGSRYFFAKYMGLSKPSRVHKSPELLRSELKSIAKANTNNQTVTMIDFWHEYEELFTVAKDVFFDDKIKSVHFSLHRLPNIEKALRMGDGIKAVFELSPDSHDIDVARASGRGFYSMEEMEKFIDALIDKVYSFEIYFMIGLPKQTPQSVMGNVDYCEHLLTKYKGKRVIPFVCPMLPFLDPGSEIFDNPEENGYRLFHRTLEEHRRALGELNWRDRLNYETDWMSRDELVAVSYKAVRRLTLAKARVGILPEGITQAIVGLIDQTHTLLKEIDEIRNLPDGVEKDAVETRVRAEVREYNAGQFRTIRSQQRPTDLGFAREQWFDTEGVIDQILGRALSPLGSRILPPLPLQGDQRDATQRVSDRASEAIGARDTNRTLTAIA